jgi:hypothetical protein
VVLDLENGVKPSPFIDFH